MTSQGPDEPDADLLSPSEALDEDEMREDPLEKGIEASERPAAVDSYGMTAAEQRAGESLDQRLAQERPDVNEGGHG